MDKKIHDKIEKLYEVEDMDGVLELLDSLSDWGKEEYGEYARALNNLDRYEEALEYLMKEKAKEDTFDWNFRVCYAYFFLENWKEAIVYGRRALELGGEFEDDAAYFVMESYQELRAFDELIQFLEKHTEIEKKDWNSFYGTALMEKKELERSIPYLKKAISIWEKEGCDMSWEGEEVARALTQV
ncbi:MAG TPA: suppressor of fused domain protein, partial [Fusobacterium sp.]|uniref:tetratricopeptide repeat protein n=1 Tax=Fusobacterium sp. TaxID=68766 RepID=UPI002F48CBEE